VLDVSATDPDGDTLSFALAGEDAALFGISEDGQLSFDTAPDFEVPSDSDGDNVYSLTVTASDGTVDTSLDVTAEVINDEEDDFQLTASQFTTGNDIPLIHACAALGGNNFSPQVSWRNAPDNTDSFALIIDDETAPCGTDANACVHWNLFNIDASIEGLIEDVDPTTLVDANGANSAVEGLTYAGTNNYEGPCPPAGNEHTYHFALYALSEDQPTMTRLDALTRSEFEEAYSGNILGQANLTGTFTD
jgi:Raf kinase inhibitor-like YbhB/YbcL family protein